MNAIIFDHKNNSNVPTSRFAVELENYGAALKAYESDMKSLIVIERRLVAQHNETRVKAQTGKKSGEIKTSIAECKTIQAQLDKLQLSAQDANARFNARVDAINAGIVQKFEGICAYAIGTGTGSAGIRYLYDECKSFAKAKGNFESRMTIYNGICNISGAVADSLDK